MAAGSSSIREASINFGDGTSQSLGALVGATNVTHTYTFAGMFIVTAAAEDTSNARVQVVTTIVVESAAPLNVTIAAPATVQVNVAAVFTATVTQATGGILEIVRYEWNFGDGTSVDTTGPSTSHVYTVADLRVASVRAVEKDGRTGTGQVQINVTPASPLNVNLTANPSPASEDAVVTFTATATGTTVPVASYSWDFDDGTTLTTSGNQVNHVYADPGTFVVTVTAVTSEGVSGSSQITLVVSPTVFSVNLTFSPSSPTSGSAVTSTATVSPPTLVVNRYVFKFNDGTPDVDGSATSVPHTFNIPGPGVESFTVEVTAFLAIDGTTSASAQVTVTVRPL